MFKNLKKNQLDKNKEPVIFMDLPDPDNHALALALAQKLNSNAEDKIDHLHLVVVGHPVNFELTKFDQQTKEFSTFDEKVTMNFKQHIKEQEYEHQYWSTEDSIKLMHANLHSLQTILLDANIDLNKISIYDGGITPSSGLSHAIHDYEEHFIDEFGNIVSKEKYEFFASQMNTLDNVGRRQLREEWCQKKINNLILKINTLQDFCLNNKQDSIKWYLAGPATPLLKIKDLDDRYFNLPGFIKAMAGTWEGNKNLLGGNFNEQVDWKAFKTIFCLPEGPLFKNANITFLSTETAKKDDWLCFNKDQLQSIFNYTDSKEYLKICKLAELWGSLKPGGGYQPAFDLALSFKESDIPFNLLKVSLGFKKDSNAFAGEKSTVTVQGLFENCYNYLFKNQQIYAYDY